MVTKHYTNNKNNSHKTLHKQQKDWGTWTPLKHEDNSGAPRSSSCYTSGACCVTTNVDQCRRRLTNQWRHHTLFLYPSFTRG
jgi:hypothetical protein